MSTQAQINANRANAESSTGPTTAEGKARSSQNATKHGLCSGRLFIAGEDPDAFFALKASLRKEHQPAGPTENYLVEQMATALWLVRRAVDCQARAFDVSMGDVPANLSVLIRYQTTNERTFHKALDTLRKLQKERKEQELDDKIGFLQKATPEELMEAVERAYQAQNPGEPLPDFTGEEREQLLESFRSPVVKRTELHKFGNPAGAHHSR